MRYESKHIGKRIDRYVFSRQEVEDILADYIEGLCTRSGRGKLVLDSKGNFIIEYTYQLKENK